MAQNRRTVELDANEVALIIGEEDASMTVRVVPASELGEEVTEVPEPYEIAVALAMRLLEDPDFHDDVLEWYESRDDIDEDDDEDEGDEDTGTGTPPKPAG